MRTIRETDWPLSQNSVTKLEANSIFLHRPSKFLSRIAIIAVATAICVTYYEFPPMSYEGMVFVSSVTVALAIGAGMLSLGLALLLLVRRKPPKPLNAMLVSAVSITMALAFV